MTILLQKDYLHLYDIEFHLSYFKINYKFCLL